MVANDIVKSYVSTGKENESRHRPTYFPKNNSKCITNLNVKCKIIKLLKDNIGEKLVDLGFGNDFLYTTPKTQP